MIEAGDVVEVERVFTQQDFDEFAAISGDDNPIHVDPDFARTTRFERTLCHGMLLFGALSAVIGNHLPGALLFDQQLKFPGPTFAGDRCVVRIEVRRVEGRIADLWATITNPRGEICCEGSALVQLVRVAA